MKRSQKLFIKKIARLLSVGSGISSCLTALLSFVTGVVIIPNIVIIGLPIFAFACYFIYKSITIFSVEEIKNVIDSINVNDLTEEERTQLNEIRTQINDEIERLSSNSEPVTHSNVLPRH